MSLEAKNQCSTTCTLVCMRGRVVPQQSPGPWLHGSASVCTIPDGHFRRSVPRHATLAAAAPLQWLMLCLRMACRSSLARGGSLTQRGRDGGLSRGCTAQLVFVPFLMGISEVGPTPRRPSSSSTAAVADVVPQNGLSLVAGSWRQFDTASARWWPEPQLHGSA